MRQKACNSAWFYISKASNLKNMTCKELAEALHTDEDLLFQIVCQGSCLIETWLYWRNQSNTLQAQACFVLSKMLPVFVMFSAADIQWCDLYRYLPGFSDMVLQPDTVQRRFIWQAVQDYPYLIAYYLLIQFWTFIEYVLQPFLGFIDHWYRFE
jgi:hypothetical protein